MNIELYSVKGYTGSALKQKLEDALDILHLPYRVSEIHHVDQFIKAGLASVPAVKIGDKVFQHPHDGLPEETVQKVVEYLQNEYSNDILIPVDFTEVSTRALEYGVMMAHHLGMGVTLAHVHQTVYDPISAGALDVEILKDAQQRLTDLADRLTREHEAKGLRIPVTAHLEVGEPAGSLLEILNHGRYQMMIMGTQATDNVIRSILGTVSSEVSRMGSKPVIVVPPQTVVRFPGKMVVGFTEELILNGVLEYLLEIGSRNHVFFDFVHITNDLQAFQTLKARLYEKLVVHRELLCGFNIRSHEDVEHGIHNILFGYAHEVRAGLVVLITQQRGFFEGLFHTSVTKNALRQPEIPVMVMHCPS